MKFPEFSGINCDFFEFCHQNNPFLGYFPSKYFLFWIFFIKMFSFLAFWLSKKFQKRKSPVKIFPKKETSILPVKKFASLICSLKNYPKRKYSFHLSTSKKGNFHSICQVFVPLFCFLGECPKRKISFQLSIS